MDQQKYNLGVEISKNFEHRNEEDTQLLYQIIQEAAELIQTGTDKQKDVAMGFVVSVYEPYIKKLSSKIYQKVKKYIEYDDVLQETYTIFIQLIYRYKKEIASFSYYVTFVLPQHMYVWSTKVKKSYQAPIDTSLLEEKITNPFLKDEDAVFNYLVSRILENDYVTFIEDRAKKKSRSSTVQHVCYDYFLGSKSCSTIASELNISYHAVYEIIGKIKKELKVFLHESVYTDIELTSTGVFKL